MLSPHKLELTASCLNCKMRDEMIFCDLSTTSIQAFQRITFATAYAKDAVLFIEGQAPRGVFVLCKGKVRLSLCTVDGKRFVLRHCQPGEVLGLSATVSGKAYEFTAETIEPCQINFVKRADFIHFLKDHADACFKASEQLGDSTWENLEFHGNREK